MRIYQVHFSRIDSLNGKSAGYSYHVNKREAKRAAKGDDVSKGEILEIDVEISKSGILHALNVYAGHADNG